MYNYYKYSKNKDKEKEAINNHKKEINLLINKRIKDEKLLFNYNNRVKNFIFKVIKKPLKIGLLKEDLYITEKKKEKNTDNSIKENYYLKQEKQFNNHDLSLYKFINKTKTEVKSIRDDYYNKELIKMKIKREEEERLKIIKENQLLKLRNSIYNNDINDKEDKKVINADLLRKSILDLKKLRNDHANTNNNSNNKKSGSWNLNGNYNSNSGINSNINDINPYYPNTNENDIDQSNNRLWKSSLAYNSNAFEEIEMLLDENNANNEKNFNYNSLKDNLNLQSILKLNKTEKKKSVIKKSQVIDSRFVPMSNIINDNYHKKRYNSNDNYEINTNRVNEINKYGKTFFKAMEALANNNTNASAYKNTNSNSKIFQIKNNYNFFDIAYGNKYKDDSVNKRKISKTKTSYKDKQNNSKYDWNYFNISGLDYYDDSNNEVVKNINSSNIDKKRKESNKSLITLDKNNNNSTKSLNIQNTNKNSKTDIQIPNLHSNLYNRNEKNKKVVFNLKKNSVLKSNIPSKNKSSNLISDKNFKNTLNTTSSNNINNDEEVINLLSQLKKDYPEIWNINPLILNMQEDSINTLNNNTVSSKINNINTNNSYSKNNSTIFNDHDKQLLSEKNLKEINNIFLNSETNFKRKGGYYDHIFKLKMKFLPKKSFLKSDPELYFKSLNVSNASATENNSSGNLQLKNAYVKNNNKDELVDIDGKNYRPHDLKNISRNLLKRCLVYK